MPLCMAMGAVLPLGKIRDYDSSFQMVLDQCKVAIDQGIVEIRTTPILDTVSYMGFPRPPDTWPAPQWVGQLFMALAAQKEFLVASLGGTVSLECLKSEDLTALAPGGSFLNMRY